MIRATGDLNDHLTTQGLGDAGDVLPTVVTMAQSTIISAPPGVHLAIGGEYNRVARTASNLRNTDASKSIDEGGLVLVTCVADSKLTILASAPTEDSKTTGGTGAPAHEARGETGRLRAAGPGISGASGTSTSKRPATGTEGGTGSGRFAQAASRRHRGGGSTGAGIRALTAHVSSLRSRRIRIPLLLVRVCVSVDARVPSNKK
mmetsp:Transcript_31820/g.93448  ORF Transcript_31820/g.93448 Transcript_31820/m.93448 type:complete len:204 (+) Transcript_31820:1283-1894(+)